MVKKKLPTAKDIWDKTTKNALTRQHVTQSKAGMYAFRLSKGRDLQGNMLYLVETRDLFSMLNQFCDDHTKFFTDETRAREFYYHAREDALEDYKRLKHKQKERIDNYEQSM